MLMQNNQKASAHEGAQGFKIFPWRGGIGSPPRQTCRNFKNPKLQSPNYLPG